MSSTGYLIWFVITTLCVVTLLAVGMVMATHAYQRQQAGTRAPKKPPTAG